MNALISAVLLLKRLPRTGWVESGVSDPESVADHSFGLAVLTMLAADEGGLNAEKALKMALLHDIVEGYLGDLTPKTKRKIPKQLLRTVEKAVFNQLIAGLPPKMARQYAQLYENYIEYKSKEARLVHLLDRRELVYEAMWQAVHGRLRLSKFGIRMRGFIRRRPRVK